MGQLSFLDVVVPALKVKPSGAAKICTGSPAIRISLRVCPLHSYHHNRTVNLGTLGEMKNISFIHYYREFGGNMGTKRSEILQESQFFWFGALFFSQNWVNFKNAQNWPKYSHFSVVFRSLFNFGWKTAHQTQKIEFPEEFRFFGYPYCPQTRDNSGEIMSFMFCFEILWWKRPLVVFSLFFKMKPDVI